MLGIKYDATPRPTPKSPATSGKNLLNFSLGNAKKHKMETNLCQKFNNFLRAILIQHLKLLSKTP